MDITVKIIGSWGSPAFVVRIFVNCYPMCLLVENAYLNSVYSITAISSQFESVSQLSLGTVPYSLLVRIGSVLDGENRAVHPRCSSAVLPSEWGIKQTQSCTHTHMIDLSSWGQRLDKLIACCLLAFHNILLTLSSLRFFFLVSFSPRNAFQEMAHCQDCLPVLVSAPSSMTHILYAFMRLLYLHVACCA